MTRRWSFAACCAAWCWAAPAPAAEAPGLEFFEKSVRPVLADNCQSCHGPEKQKGGLRLDSRDAVLSGGESGPAIVPGDPARSRLVQAVGYADTLRLPPKQKLPPEQVATPTSWVEMGAPEPEAKDVRP